MNQDVEWLLRDKYGGIASAGFEADRARLAAGEPLAYVIGWTPFCGRRIFLDSRPLIPRTETEFWTARTIRDLQGRGNVPLKVLDLCAGSGAVGVALLAALSNASADFVEIDERHHATIARNLDENGIAPSRARIMGGSLFENISGTYDAILTNPPYIDPALSGRVDRNVISHEPALALFGGEGGTQIIAEILARAPDVLARGGLLVIEHEPEQESFVAGALPGIVPEVDQYGVVRFSRYTRT